MSSKPAVEMRLMIEDARWPGYREKLEAKYEAVVAALLRPGKDHARMAALAAEARGLQFALEQRDVLLESDPTPPPPEDS